MSKSRKEYVSSNEIELEETWTIPADGWARKEPELRFKWVNLQKTGELSAVLTISEGSASEKFSNIIEDEVEFNLDSDDIKMLREFLDSL